MICELISCCPAAVVLIGLICRHATRRDGESQVCFRGWTGLLLGLLLGLLSTASTAALPDCDQRRIPAGRQQSHLVFDTTQVHMRAPHQ